MKALLVIDHGSRVPAAHTELMALVEKLRADRPDWMIEGAHLELVEPRFAPVLDQMIQAGATEIQVLPWFLASGRHLNEDVPTLIQEALVTHPQVKIELLPHLGQSSQLQSIAWQITDGQ